MWHMGCKVVVGWVLALLACTPCCWCRSIACCLPCRNLV